MDQNSTGGSDKRNWRERLGIGTKEHPIIANEMPKVAAEFKPAVEPPAPALPKAVMPAVRPAPMAPRPAAKVVPAPGSARPAAAPAPRPLAVAPDALANKLKSQRDAAEKLAEQRVAAAKQRAEAALPPMMNGGAEKPKFTFADDDTKTIARPAATSTLPSGASRSAPQTQRPALPQGYTNQIAPPRPPLGGGQAVPPRAAPVPQQTYPQGSAYPQGQPYFPQQYPQGYQPQGYAPVPPSGYRPIDPATGYTPPPPFNPQLRQTYAPTGASQSSRLQVPTPRPPASGFNSPAPGLGAPSPRLTNSPSRQAAPAAYGQADEDDIFEQPAPRSAKRTTADEYSQAYREVETGYEDEEPRTRGPLLFLVGALVLALAAGSLAWWGYTTYVKNSGSLTSSKVNVPVVAAPQTPAKTVPDAAVTDTANAGKVVNTSKKLIYDRIVGDQEVTGGKIVPTEEQPVQPVNNTAPADPAIAVPPPPGTGNDGTPLPLPPPPGGTSGTQGSLEPSGKVDSAKTDQAMITHAAGSSPAAVVAPTQGSTNGSATTTLAAGATAAAGSVAIAPLAEAAKPAASVDSPATSEAITDVPAEPVIKEKKVLAKTADKKMAAVETPVKSLGAKPVVLVPPSKLALQNKSSVAPIDQTGGTITSNAALPSGGGLYGNSEVGQNAQAAATPIEVPKKRKTFLDLFRSESQTAVPAVSTPQAEIPAEPIVTQQVALAAPKVVAPAPAPAPSLATGAYVAQLASFKTKAEANAEYARMAAKHGPIIKRYAPIIEQAQVAGTTRYRLNIGPMATSDVASSFCTSLISAGERDCLVHRQ